MHTSLAHYASATMPTYVTLERNDTTTKATKYYKYCIYSCAIFALLINLSTALDLPLKGYGT